MEKESTKFQTIAEQHPSLKLTEKDKKKARVVWTEPGSKGVRLRTPDLNASKRAKMFWRKCNEERMLESLERWKKAGGMTLRILFSLKDADGKYRTFRGKTVVVRKVPNQGTMWRIVDGVIERAVEEAGK